MSESAVTRVVMSLPLKRYNMEAKRKMPAAEIAASVLNLFPKPDRREQCIAVELFRQLAEGLPVPRAAIADRLNVSREVVDTFLESSWEVHYDDTDRIVGYGGLALRKTAHRFTVDGRSCTHGARGTVYSFPRSWAEPLASSRLAR
jgi:hypothetical protein